MPQRSSAGRRRASRPSWSQALRRQAPTFQQAVQWPLDTCLVNGDWRERGLAVVVFVRRGPGGARLGVGYVVDLCCRGVQTVQVALADGAFAGPAAIHALIEQICGPRLQVMERVSPFLAARIIRSGHAYARGLGLPQHPDHDWAQKVFASIPDAEEPVPCGRFGKPVVDVERPDVLQRLDARVGPGSYHLVARTGVVPEG